VSGGADGRDRRERSATHFISLALEPRKIVLSPATDEEEQALARVRRFERGVNDAVSFTALRLISENHVTAANLRLVCGAARRHRRNDHAVRRGVEASDSRSAG